MFDRARNTVLDGTSQYPEHSEQPKDRRDIVMVSCCQYYDLLDDGRGITSGSDEYLANNRMSEPRTKPAEETT